MFADRAFSNSLCFVLVVCFITSVSPPLATEKSELHHIHLARDVLSVRFDSAIQSLKRLSFSQVLEYFVSCFGILCASMDYKLNEYDFDLFLLH